MLVTSAVWKDGFYDFLNEKKVVFYACNDDRKCQTDI
jgi:hypothetical protein